MPGIISCGGYVPHYRLARSAIGEMFAGPPAKGTRAVASYNEDATTMGVAAARNALRSLGRFPALDALWFATTEPPYSDKTNATAIHAALRLDRQVAAFDANGAQRSTVGLLKSALASTQSSLVVAGDVRGGMPNGADEREGGDAAAAFVIGEGDDVIANLVGSASVTEEFTDRWRTPGDARSKQWEERFSELQYVPLAVEAFEQGLKNAEISAADIDRLIITGLSSRAVRGVTRKLGVDADKLASDLSATVGNSGAAHPSLLLVNEFEQAKPGQVIAVLVLADGADMLVFRTTDAMSSFEPHLTVAEQVEAGDDSLPYSKFLSWRGQITVEPPRRPEPARASSSAAARRTDWKYGFVASEDRESGAIHMPPARVSFEGGNADDMVPRAMADVAATIATFTIDKLSYSLSPPTVFAVLDFDGGGRLPCELTDVDADAVKIGDRVEMTFRKINESDGIKNYFWKARPQK